MDIAAVEGVIGVHVGEPVPMDGIKWLCDARRGELTEMDERAGLGVVVVLWLLARLARAIERWDTGR